MRWYLAILLEAGVLLVVATVDFRYGQSVARDLGRLVALLSALVFALEAWRLQLFQYRSLVPRDPFLIFVLTLFLWPVTFPLFLDLRHRVQAGRLSPDPNRTTRRRVILKRSGADEFRHE